MSTFRLVDVRALDPVTGTTTSREIGVRDGVLCDPADVADAETFSGGGHLLMPGFVDLYTALVHPERDGAAAVAGGFTTVVASPEHPTLLDRPDAVTALRGRWADAPCRVQVVAALTSGLEGADLAEVGLLREAGAVAVGQGSRLLDRARVLRHALEYAERLGLTVFLRGGEADLEAGGVVRDGPRAVRLGLPGVPIEAEEIGIHRIAALARRTGASVHLTHVWTAAGVRALRRVRDEGLSITASTTAWHLALDPDSTGRNPYDGRLRFVPPLGDTEDRAALVQAVKDGIVDAVASDHRPLPPHAQDHAFQAATPGAAGLDVAFSLALSALGDPVSVARALSAGPRRVLGLAPAKLHLGEVADLVLVDPEGETRVDRPLGAHANTPIAGATLPGRVLATWVGGVARYGDLPRS